MEKHRSILLGSLSLSLALGACVDRNNDKTYFDHDGVDIVVTSPSAPAPIASGQNARFQIEVTNAGTKDAGTVRFTDIVGSQTKLLSIACTASGGAQCPDALGPSMQVAKLPVHGKLEFVAVAALDGLSTGTIINSFKAECDQDVDPNNNTVASDVLVR